MDIRLLGPIEATLDGRPVALGTPQQRAVLAMLALEVNQTVSADRLSEGLWGERAPATAPKMVQLYVSQLRKLLRGSAAEIVTRGRGYELRLPDERVDSSRFERLIAAAEHADGEPNGEARAALALWRGTPLADVAHEPFASAEIRRLEELRLQAAELAIDSDLAAHRHREVLGELRSLIADEPLRERPRAQQMLALYRSGRQSEALEAYRDARSALVEAIGVEPGPELRQLHDAILRQDPRLEPVGAVDAIGLPPELDTTTPLVGREAELEWLRGHWRRALAGAGRVVLVAGERGIGKTRLVAELAAEVLKQHATVLYGSHEVLAAAHAAEGPTLLILDDFTDAAGLDLTGAALDGRAALVIVTAEDVPAAASPQPTATLILARLDADGVRALTRLYAGEAEDADVPVERLLAASDGLPRLLHGAASEWARMLELRRLADSVGRIAADRSQLRAAEDDLVASIVKLQAARERSAPDAIETGADAVCPYKGLATFTAGDAGWFFGRERLVAELVARATGSSFLAIVGPSGSGKSSALHAGLLAALAAGVLPGSEAWTQAALRPGEHPLRTLRQALAAAPDPGRMILAVDQFEETFTTCREESERAAFVDALLACTRDARRRTLVVVAVRADYYGRCAAYTELSRLLGANHVLVGPMAREELRRAIELPARRAGLRVESELADALVADVEGRPGGLPLMSSALLELWQRRDGRTLRAAEYQRTGGVQGAVARQAEQAYERLDPAGRLLARRVLLRLTGEGDGDAVVRRRAALSEFEGDAVVQVLDVLAAARLVTISEGEVEVAHEALLREWPRLRAWLEEDAEGRRLHLHLMNAARGWDAADRDPAELYRGARLASALDWSTLHALELDGLEGAFVDASRAAAELENVRQRRANRRLRVLLGGVGGLLALAVVAGLVAISQRGQARDAALAADAQLVGADALRRERLDEAARLARAGVALDDSVATRGNLLSALMREPLALGELPGDGLALWTVVASPDGRLVAVAGEAAVVTFVDASTRLAVGEQYRLPGGNIQNLAFSPDSRTLAVAGHQPAIPGSSGLVDLVDSRTHERRVRIALPPVPGSPQEIGLNVLFLPDGRDVVVEQTSGLEADGRPSVLRRFDGETGAAEGRPLNVGRHTSFAVEATADRRRLFVTNPLDDETTMVDAESLRTLRRWPAGADLGAPSADGSVFALGTEEGGVRLLDLRSGHIRRFAGRHRGFVDGLRFTPDGRTLVTSGSDGVLIVWDVARGEIRERLTGHAKGEVYGLEVSPDGRSLYSGGFDERAFAWDLTGDRSLVRPFAAARAAVPDDPEDALPRGLTLSPDGRTLALGHLDGKVDFLDAGTLRRQRSLQALRGFVGAIAYSPDGRLLAVAGRHGQVTLWDARTLRPSGELDGLKGNVQTLAFSPDGGRLAVAELSETPRTSLHEARGGSVRVWDVRSRAPTWVRFQQEVPQIAFSPDGSLLASTAVAPTTEVRDARSGRLVASLRTPDNGRSVAFSPDSALLATGHFDGTAQLWSTASWKPVGRPLAGHDERRLFWMEFTPDGAMLATSGQDGAVALWDIKTQKPIGPPLTVAPDRYIAADLSPDGSRLFAVADTRRAVRWDVAPAAWKRHACAVAGRDLTRAEWREALPGQPYRTICRTG